MQRLARAPSFVRVGLRRRYAILKGWVAGWRYTNPTRLYVTTTIILGASIAILCWPIETVPTRTGLDASWVAALHVAAAKRLHFGSEIVYTFGPLGFLGLPQPYYGATSAFATVAVASANLIACIGLMHLTRRSFPIWLAVPAVYVAARSLSWNAGWDLVGLLGLALAVETIRVASDHPPRKVLFAGLGVLAGVALLGKLNVGLVVATVGAITTFAIGRPRTSAILTFSATAAASLLLIWTALDQRLADLLNYAAYSLEIIGGYSSAMGIDFGVGSDWVLGLAALAVTILTLAAIEDTREWSRSSKITLVLVGAIVAFAMFKSGFVRSRFGPFFGAALVLLPLFAHRQRQTFYGVATAGLLAMFLAVTGVGALSYLDPRLAIQSAYDQASAIVWHRQQAAAATAADLRNKYALSPDLIAAIGSGTYHIHPSETAIAYAYPELRWQPLPVFQSYQAYTSNLDRLNAGALRSDDGPNRILWLTPPGQPPSIDGRIPYVEAPETAVAMICRYLPVAADPSWQVLIQVHDRCGIPERLGSISVLVGEEFRPPVERRANRLIVMRIRGIGSTPLQRVSTLVYKSPPWFLQAEGSQIRLVPSTAAGPIPIGATGSLGYREGLAPSAPSRSYVILSGQSPISADPLKIEFFSIRVMPAAYSVSNLYGLTGAVPWREADEAGADR